MPSSSEIAPAPIPALNHGRLREIKGIFQHVEAMWGRLEHAWHSHHLSHRGSYSIERLQALEDYCHRTPFFRVLCICLMLPLPAFLISLIVEFIPLQNPSEGWRANHGIWTRFFCGNVFISIGFLIQIKEMVPELNLTLKEIWFIALSTAASTDGVFIGMADGWAFPVPFGLVLIAPIYIVILVIVFVLVVGRGRFQKNAAIRSTLKDQVTILVAQASLLVVYPAFGAVYNALPPTEQAFFVILLPITKAVMNHVVAFASRSVIESMPGITLLSVEVFNALYSVKCMQNAGSSVAYVAILSWDLFEAVMAFRDIRSQIDNLHRLSHRIITLNSYQTMMKLAMEICLEPGVLDSTCLASIRVRASTAFKLTESQKHYLATVQTCIESLYQESHSLDTSEDQRSLRQTEPFPVFSKSDDAVDREKMRDQTFLSNDKPKQVKNKLELCSESTIDQTKKLHDHNTHIDQPHFGLSQNKVHPSITLNPTIRDMLSTNERRKLIEQTLAILFQCEFHVLVEYVECVIPLMYALYMVILFHLPSVIYYPDTIGMTLSHLQVIVLKVFLYALLEILSFVALHFVIKWKFGFSPAYILAFVLDHQFFEFQGRLVVSYLYVLELTLYHFGKNVLLIISSCIRIDICCDQVSTLRCGLNGCITIESIQVSATRDEESRIHFKEQFVKFPFL